MVPLTMPATRSTVSPASDWVSGRITGMAPATAASKYRSTWAFSAACASSPVDMRHQRLVRGDDRLAVLERGQDRLARRFDGPHHLDDDVDVVAGHQFVDVVGEQLDRHAAVVGDPAHADAAQHQRRTDAGGQVVGALLDDADDLAADVAQAPIPLRRPASRHHSSTHLTSRLSRSSTVSRRRIRRARPSRTATTAGRPIRL